jgi:hypothetical protein
MRLDLIAAKYLVAVSFIFGLLWERKAACVNGLDHHEKQYNPHEHNEKTSNADAMVDISSISMDSFYGFEAEEGMPSSGKQPSKTRSCWLCICQHVTLPHSIMPVPFLSLTPQTWLQGITLSRCASS